MKQKNILISNNIFTLLISIFVFSTIATIVYGRVSPERAWHGFLIAAFYTLCLSLAGAVFTAIHNAANAGWGILIRRVPEAMASYLPYGALTILFIFPFLHNIYPWAGGENISGLKDIYLSSGTFMSRAIIYLALWIIFVYLILTNSLKQDLDGKLEHTKRNVVISSIFIVVFAVTFSLATFDWLMSLTADWYSTIFAVYQFAGLFMSGLAVIIILIILVDRSGMIDGIRPDHYETVAKLMFAFSIFWAYIWISQYLLIWYTNFPEETNYYLKQTSSDYWRHLFIANLFLNWILPFLLLLGKKAKSNKVILILACTIILIGRYIDLYLIVNSSILVKPVFGFPELVQIIGFLSLFTAVVLRRISRINMVPVKDPYLIESIHLKA